MTIPGIDRNSAITILSEISNDMSQFSNHIIVLFLGLGLLPDVMNLLVKRNLLKFQELVFILSLI